MTKKTYKQLRTELDQIVAELQNPDIDIDEALILHEKAKKLLAETDKYLSKAEILVSKASKDMTTS